MASSSSSSSLSTDPLILSAQRLATAHHAPYDPSHDIYHVSRVTSLSLLIAHSLPQSDPPLDFLVIHLAALFHDLLDKKYLTVPSLTPQERLQEFWKENEEKEGGGEFGERRKRLVERIIENVSYSKEVKRGKRIQEIGDRERTEEEKEEEEWWENCKELHCVQDADKLDAIGSFGIMRCCAYSAATNRPLHLPLSSSTTSPSSFPPRGEAGGDAISHFEDKLVKLQGMMKTEKGREMARVRTERLREFMKWTEEEAREVEEGRGL